MRNILRVALLVSTVAAVAASSPADAQTCNLGTTYFFDKSVTCPNPGRELCNTGRMYLFNTWSYGGKRYLIGSTYSSAIFYDVTNPLSPTVAIDPGSYNPWGESENDGQPDDDRQQWDVAMLDGFNYGIAMFQNYGWSVFQVQMANGVPSGFTTTDRFKFAGVPKFFIPTSSPASFARLFKSADGNDVFAVGSWLNKGGPLVVVAQLSNGKIGANTAQVVGVGPVDRMETAYIAGKWWLFALSETSFVVKIYDLSTVTAAALANPLAAPSLNPVTTVGSGLTDFFLDKDRSRLYTLVGGNGAAKINGLVGVYDMSNPASPAQIAAVSTAPVDSSVVAAGGDLVVVAAANPTSAPWIQAFSIVNLASPIEVGAGQLGHTPKTDEQVEDLWVGQGSPNYAIYGASWSASFMTQVSATCLSNDPHAAFTASVSAGSGTASCPTPLTSPSTGVAAQGFPGDTFAITDTSYGKITQKTLTITAVPSGAQEFSSQWDALNGWHTPLVWSPQGTTAPGEYQVTMTALPASPTSMSTQSIFLCGNAAASLVISQENGAACSTTPCPTQLLVGDNLNLTAAATTGRPTLYTFFVQPPSPAPAALLQQGTASAPGSASTLSNKGTYTFGVVAQYAFSGSNPAACTDPMFMPYLAGGVYNSCSSLSAQAGSGVATFEVWQNSQLVAASGASGTLLVDQPTTLKFTGKVGAGLVPNLMWTIPNVSSPACNYAGVVAPYTGITCGPIPANTFLVGASVTIQLSLQVCSGTTPGQDCTAGPPVDTFPASAIVVPSQYSITYHVTPQAPAVGQATSVVLDSINGPFSGITVNYGGQACDNTTQKFVPCGDLFGIPGSNPCAVGKNLASFSYNSTGQKIVTVSGSVPGTTVNAAPATVMVSAGSCPSQTLTINASPAAPIVGATVSFTTSPGLSLAGDTLTFQFGDGGSSTISYPCPITCAVSHAYAAAATYTVSATGTVGGLSYTGSTAITVGSPPVTGTLTITASPASPMAGSSVIFTTTPGVSQGGDSITFQFGDGAQGVLGYPCPLGACSIAHTYASPGPFTVQASGTVRGGAAAGSLSLTVQNPCQYPAAPTANFTWSPAQQRAGSPIQFTDQSTGNPTSWSWTFGDGGIIFAGGSSSLQNPPYTFAKEGIYTVTLTVSNCRGSTQKQMQVTVLPACAQTAAPTPDFVWGPTGTLTSFPEQTQPYVGQQVTLTDASTNSPTSWHWYDFQEGLVDQTVSSPTFTFTWQKPGDKNVRMTATNCFGTSVEKLKSVHIYDDVRHVTADFTTSPAALTTGVPITFTAAQGYANGDPNGFAWTFDDGTTQTGASVTFTFECSGSHKVILTSTRTNASGQSYSASTTKGLNVDGKACGPESVMAVDAAKVIGLNGTNWHADLRIFNASKYPTLIWVSFLQAGADNANAPTFGPYYPALPPKGTLVLDDILQWVADNLKQTFTKAALRITYKNEDSVAPIVLVRTYNLLPDGSKYGQITSGIQVWPGESTSPMWLTGLRNNGLDTGFRTNYSIVNLRGDASCSSCITFTLFDEAGTPVATKQSGLWAFGYIQDSIKNLFGPTFGDIGTFSLKVDVPSGQDIRAFASVMDNQTGDPVMIPADPLADSPVYLVAIAHNGGVNNTVWRTDLQLTNPDANGAHTWEVKYLPKASDQLPAVVRSVTLAPYKTLLATDAVSWVFSGLLPDSATTSGVIRIAPKDGSNVYPVVSARSYNLTANGTFGQGIPPLWAARGVSATGDNKRLLLTGMSSEDISRTNLGFVNLSETDGVDMSVYFYDEAGNLLNPVGTDGKPVPYTYANGPGSWDQDKLENRFNRAFKSYGVTLPANLRAISAEIVVNGGGPAMVYASVIDGKTGDPNFIIAQPAP